MAYARAAWWLGIVIAALLLAVPAATKPTPAAKCLAAKLKASGKKAIAKLACQAKAVQKQKPVDAACLGKAESALTKAFTKAQSKPVCITTGDAGAVEALVDEFVQPVVAALPGGASKDAGKCAASKQKASGRYASAELTCQATAALKAVGVDATCIQKGEAAFQKAFSKAEQKGGCATTGDVGALDEMVDDFVDDVVAQLIPVPTTTVTTTTSSNSTAPPATVPGTTVTTAPGTTSSAPTTTVTTTSTAQGTTTSTTMGPTVHTVMVGPEGSYVFEPADLTIKVGDTVHWVWASSLHSVVSGTVTGMTETPDGNFCSNVAHCGQTADVGATFDHVFTAAGVFPYFCAPHGTFGMVGTITVQP